MVVMGDCRPGSIRQEYTPRRAASPPPGLAQPRKARDGQTLIDCIIATLWLFLNYRGLWGERWGSRGGHVERFEQN